MGEKNPEISPICNATYESIPQNSFPFEGTPPPTPPYSFIDPAFGCVPGSMLRLSPADTNSLRLSKRNSADPALSGWVPRRCRRPFRLRLLGLRQQWWRAPCVHSTVAPLLPSQGIGPGHPPSTGLLGPERLTAWLRERIRFRWEAIGTLFCGMLYFRKQPTARKGAGPTAPTESSGAPQV